VPYARQGFNAVIGNPPWDKPRFERKEVIGSLHLPVLEAMRMEDWVSLAEQHLAENPSHEELVVKLIEGSQALGRFLESQFPHTNGLIEGVLSPGEKDLYLYFMERACDSVTRDGLFGLVVGAGMQKNPAASGVRHLAAVIRAVRHFHQFVNLKRIFQDLPQVVEFCTVVVNGNGPSKNACLSLGQKDEEILFDHCPPTVALTCQPPHFFIESVCDTAHPHGTLKMREFLEKELGGLTSELHKSADDASFVPLADVLPDESDARPWPVTSQLILKGYAPLRGSRSIRLLEPYPEGLGGKRSAKVDLVVNLSHERPVRFLRRSRYFRLAIRRHVGSVHTNERSVIPCILTPGFLANDQLLLEGKPWSRPNIAALVSAGLLASFVAEQTIRHLVGTCMSLSILGEMPVPEPNHAQRMLLAHGVLRLTACDCGYEPLWREQLDDWWREEGKPPMTWPVLAVDDERWAVRAAIDAVVADAYDLNRDQYAHILSTFSHSSYKKAPELCLAHFDELKQLGLEKFTRKHDPYWDIPLNEDLPQPVIDLPTLGEAKEDDDGEFRLNTSTNRRKSRRSRS
jgi:hypothetical protein